MKPPEKCKLAGLKSLADYIAENYGGNQSAFARDQGVKRSQITQWLAGDYVIADGALYLKRRDIKPPA
jgi:DNA-binding transcriptional regulator YdaS (Cro superfamily)